MTSDYWDSIPGPECWDIPAFLASLAATEIGGLLPGPGLRTGIGEDCPIFYKFEEEPPMS